MGGNRVKISHTHRNIMITMLLGGIWHGASWNFMIWGGLHGLYMVIERSASSLFSFRIWAGLKWFYTFTLVSLTWVLFRSDSFADSQTIYTQLFVGDYRPEDLLNWSGLLIIGLVLVHFINHLSKIHKRVMISVPLYVMIISVLFLMMLLFTAESAEPFIYFQF
jgi:alginate O-acetyltransferase complex protein AlgI